MPGAHSSPARINRIASIRGEVRRGATGPVDDAATPAGINVIGPAGPSNAAGAVARALSAAVHDAGLDAPLDLFVAEPLALEGLLAAPSPCRLPVLFGWSHLAHVPAAARGTIRRMHAVLAPNAFTAAAFRAAGHRNVVYVPFVPEAAPAVAASTREGFTFASELDAQNSLERQNLNYLLNAFVRARFAGRRDVVLDIAVIGSVDGLPLEAISAAHPNVRFGEQRRHADASSRSTAPSAGLSAYRADGARIACSLRPRMRVRRCPRRDDRHPGTVRADCGAASDATYGAR